MTTEELHWLAGILEGEGSFGRNRGRSWEAVRAAVYQVCDGRMDRYCTRMVMAGVLSNPYCDNLVSRDALCQRLKEHMGSANRKSLRLSGGSFIVPRNRLLPFPACLCRGVVLDRVERRRNIGFGTARRYYDRLKSSINRNAIRVVLR